MANIGHSQLMDSIKQIAFDTAQVLYLHFTPEMAQDIYKLIETSHNINKFCNYIEEDILDILTNYTKDHILNTIWIEEEKETVDKGDELQ